MNINKPETYDELRAYVNSDRAALIARNVLPHIPKSDYLVVVDKSPVSHSPPAPGFPASNDDRTERDRFEEKAPPVAPGVNLYRVDLWEGTEKRAKEGFVFVKPVPHSAHGPYELHVSDYAALRRPESWDYDTPQKTFGHVSKQVPDPDYDRDSHLPI
jgi:hypothetical protein